MAHKYEEHKINTYSGKQHDFFNSLVEILEGERDEATIDQLRSSIYRESLDIDLDKDAIIAPIRDTWSFISKLRGRVYKEISNESFEDFLKTDMGMELRTLFTLLELYKKLPFKENSLGCSQAAYNSSKNIKKGFESMGENFLNNMVAVFTSLKGINYFSEVRIRFLDHKSEIEALPFNSNSWESFSLFYRCGNVTKQVTNVFSALDEPINEFYIKSHKVLLKCLTVAEDALTVEEYPLVNDQYSSPEEWPLTLSPGKTLTLTYTLKNQIINIGVNNGILEMGHLIHEPPILKAYEGKPSQDKLRHKIHSFFNSLLSSFSKIGIEEQTNEYTLIAILQLVRKHTPPTIPLRGIRIIAGYILSRLGIFETEDQYSPSNKGAFSDGLDDKVRYMLKKCGKKNQHVAATFLKL